jgi:type I restriction enzyme, S subunit
MHRAVDISVGSLSPTINWKTLAVQEFLLPPKEQQAKLAELLWAADGTLEAYHDLFDQLLRILNSMYNEYFNRNKVESSELGGIAEIIMGQSPDGSTYNQEGIGLPLINGPTEFTDRYPVKVQWTAKPTKQCKEGDILLCVRGSTTGRINISNDVYCIGRGIAAIRGKSGYLTDYLEHLLTYFVEEILRLSAGSTFPNIDSKSLKSIKVPSYSTRDQEVIVKKLNDTNEVSRKLKGRISETQSVIRNLINQSFN